ncbi:hypothetical protein BT93_E2250 [Corymbia citriodora subsp. variegata]|nr:hypothetical protein BT93_E2250 [Corymbia citriodora subsp. variegata]
MVACSGELVEDIVESRGGQMVEDSMHGFHCSVLDISIFQKEMPKLTFKSHRKLNNMMPHTSKPE